MSTLYLMVGPPGAGKSFFIKNYYKQNNCVIVSRDEIRFSLLRDGEDYFAHEKQVYNIFVNNIQQALDKNKDVYADATHINGISRYKLLSRLNLKGVDIIPIVVKPPLEECLSNNRLRHGLCRTPDNVVYNMYKSYTDPKNDEGNMPYQYKNILYITEKL